MTGHLTLPNSTPAANQATRRAYVESLITAVNIIGKADITAMKTAPCLKTDTTALASYLPLAGGPATGHVTLPGVATNNLHASTKAYVDNAISAIPGTDLTGLLPKAGGTGRNYAPRSSHIKPALQYKGLCEQRNSRHSSS